MEKVKVSINVMVHPNLVPMIEKFNKIGGIYDNLNSGLLSEPLMPLFLSEHFGEPVEFINGNGIDYRTSITGKTIENKALTMSKGSSDLKNFGEVKENSDYLSIFHPDENRFFLMPMKEAQKFLINEDITNNKEHVPFCKNLIPSSRISKASINTMHLLNHSEEISLSLLDK